MNISIKNVINCEKISEKKVIDMADKLNINIDNDNLSEKKSRLKICNNINKKMQNINPCGMALYNNTTLNIKRYQLSVANHLITNRGVIVIHSVGTGKTITSISSAECLLSSKIIEHVIVITPTSLQKNFISQAKMYGLTEKEIDAKYTFYTIQSIVNAIDSHTAINATNSLIIIDEAHNLRTLNGSRFEHILKFTKKAKKIMLLTATPLINYKHDVINLVALIRNQPSITIDELDKLISNKNQKPFKEYLSDIFSFYTKDDDDNDPNFPLKKVSEVYLPMTSSYLTTYSNVEKGYISQIREFVGKNVHVFYNGVRRASNILDKKSPKVDWIVDKIKSDPKAKFIIFSHFINMGMKPVMEWLDSHKKKYAFVTGELTIDKRQEAVDNYNSDQVQILFISKAGSEGLDLKNTTYIIIMEPSWNENSIEQIIGRGIRYKSHESLKKSKRCVHVYKLYCVKPIEYKNLNKITDTYILEYNDDVLSVDLYLRNYSWLKQQELITFFKLLHKFKIE